MGNFLPRRVIGYGKEYMMNVNDNTIKIKVASITNYEIDMELSKYMDACNALKQRILSDFNDKKFVEEANLDQCSKIYYHDRFCNVHCIIEVECAKSDVTAHIRADV